MKDVANYVQKLLDDPNYIKTWAMLVTPVESDGFAEAVNCVSDVETCAHKEDIQADSSFNPIFSSSF
jgi:hypothetical protein